MRKKLIALVIALVCLLSAFLHGSYAEDEYYIICQPDSFVYVRKTPKMTGEEIGRMELGDMVYFEGEKKNGFMHISASLETDGWIYAGFLTSELTIRTEQRAVQRRKVACRRSIKGKRRKWLTEGDMVTVYAWSDEWAITDEGFIMTKFLEVEYDFSNSES